MFPGDIKVGYVFRYSYLWHRQHVAGRREGDKNRPCLVLALVKIDEGGRSIVRVLPITHSPPDDPGASIEIPRAVKLRLNSMTSNPGLSSAKAIVSYGPDRISGRWTRLTDITGRCHQRSSVRSSSDS